MCHACLYQTVNDLDKCGCDPVCELIVALAEGRLNIRFACKPVGKDGVIMKLLRRLSLEFSEVVFYQTVNDYRITVGI